MVTMICFLSKLKYVFLNVCFDSLNGGTSAVNQAISDILPKIKKWFTANLRLLYGNILQQFGDQGPETPRRPRRFMELLWPSMNSLGVKKTKSSFNCLKQGIHCCGIPRFRGKEHGDMVG